MDFDFQPPSERSRAGCMIKDTVVMHVVGAVPLCLPVSGRVHNDPLRMCPSSAVACYGGWTRRGNPDFSRDAKRQGRPFFRYFLWSEKRKYQVLPFFPGEQCQQVVLALDGRKAVRAFLLALAAFHAALPPHKHVLPHPALKFRELFIATALHLLPDDMDEHRDEDIVRTRQAVAAAPAKILSQGGNLFFEIF